jgi:hypothetical protein
MFSTNSASSNSVIYANNLRKRLSNNLFSNRNHEIYTNSGEGVSENKISSTGAKKPSKNFSYSIKKNLFTEF